MSTRKNKRWTTADIAKIKRLRAEHKVWKDIAVEMDCNESAAQKALYRSGS